MRRKDRETTQEEALIILDQASWGVLSAVDSSNTPYSIPLSLARDGNWLYFHCALEGRKLKVIRARPETCIAFVGNVEFPSEHFTAVYESAIVSGTAEEVINEEEKKHGLRIICKRFTPDNMNAFDEEIKKMLAVTGVWKIHIDKITGKRRNHP